MVYVTLVVTAPAKVQKFQQITTAIDSVVNVAFVVTAPAKVQKFQQITT